MAIRINDSSNSVTGTLSQTLGNVTASMVGASDTLPDYDGSISRRLENVRASFRNANTEIDMDGWPFVYTTFSLGNIIDRTTVDPARTIIAYSNFTIHQALFMHDAASREQTRTRLQGLRAINPDLNIIYHIDWHQIELDIQATIKAERWLEAQVLANPSDQDDYLLRQSSSGPYTTRNSFPTHIAFNWGCTSTVRQRVAAGQIAEWSDNDGAAGSLNAGIPIHWMQDTLPEYDNRYANATHSGTITGAISPTQILIPTWPDGGPGSATYYFKAIESNGTSWDYATVTSVDIGYGPGTDLVTLNRSLENMSVSNGDTFVITSSNAEEGRTPSGELTRAQFRQGCVDMGSEIVSRIKSNCALDVDPHHNGANFNWVAKKGGYAPTYPSEFVGQWGGIHWEWIGEDLGFDRFPRSASTSGEYRTYIDGEGRSYDPEDWIKSIEYARLMLKPNDETASGYPCVWLNALTRRNTTDQAIYSWIAGSRLDAAYTRFFYCLGWCMENVSPQVEHESHDVPAWIDEVVIEAGNPVTTRGFGTYDPEGNGGVEGTLAQMTPDFGTWGYVKWFENCVIIINLADPGNITWVPSWLGGQSIDVGRDVWTVTGVPSGKKLQHFDRSTYINPSSGKKFSGKRPSDFDFAAIMYDNTLNDATRGPQTGGGYDNGDTIACAPLECMVLMIADA